MSQPGPSGSRTETNLAMQQGAYLKGIARDRVLLAMLMLTPALPMAVSGPDASLPFILGNSLHQRRMSKAVM